MPEASFDKDIRVPGGQRSQFVQLKKKGEKIRFRIAATPHYNAKHWLSRTEWVFCPRTMDESDAVVPCEYCNKLEEAFQIQDQKERDEEVRKWKPKLNFYYPILNLDTKEAQIFNTTLSVHLAIRDNEKAGVDVFKSDWQVTRNEGSPANYYGTVRLAETSKLTKKEEEALKVAKELDLEKIIGSSRTSKSVVGPADESAEELEPEANNGEAITDGDIEQIDRDLSEGK